MISRILSTGALYSKVCPTISTSSRIARHPHQFAGFLGRRRQRLFDQHRLARFQARLAIA